MQQGMTLKQYRRRRFYDLLDAYLEAQRNIDTPEGRIAFIALSVQLHSAKGDVPKRLWPLINAKLR